MYLHALGESVIEVGEVRVGPGAPQLFGILLHLALESGRRVPRVRLQELLFPTADETNGGHSLRQLLYRVRRIGVDLRADGTGVLVPADSVRSDYQEFLAPPHGERRDLAKLSGGILPGFAPAFSSPYAEWLEARRGELVARIRRTLMVELAGHRRASQWHAAEQTARAILSLDEFNEEATLALAEAMALSGSKLDAVRLLDGYLEEVGPRDHALRVPAAILKRRIAERLEALPHASTSPFVGRDEPMRVLRGLLDAARAGHGSACHIWGEAGIGKTRLVSEFARAAVLDGVCVQQVSAQPHDVRRPMGAFIDLVPNLLRLPGALGCSPEAIGFLRKLYNYEGNSSTMPSPDAQEAELLSANITTAISELLDALTSESVIVLALDDAQWLDLISVRVITDLVAERKARRLLILLVSRAMELAVSVGHVERLSAIRLKPLTAEDSSALLAELFRRHGVAPDPSVANWYLGIAAGNPFFLRSLALHYATTRDSGGIPEALTALLNQRLSLLDSRARHVFTAAALLGRHSTLAHLEAVVGLPRYALIEALQSLDDLGFITTAGSNVGVTHALLSEIALKATAHSVRILMHRNSALLLGAVAHAETSAAALWDSADHWVQSGHAQEAMKALRACARHALEIGQPNDAITALQRAVDLAPTPEDVAEVRRELLTAAQIAGAWTTVLDVIGAIRSAGTLVPGGAGCFDGLELEAMLRSSADPRPLVDRLRSHASRSDLSACERLRACMLLAAAAEDLLWRELADYAHTLARSVRDTADVNAERLEFEVVYYASFGDLDLAADAARKLLVVAQSHQNCAASCRMQLTSGGGLLRAGLREGLEVLMACYAMASEHRLTTAQYRAASHLAGFLRDDRQREESITWQKRATSAFEQLEGREKLPTFYSNCVVFAIAAGDFEVAKVWLNRALIEVPSARVGHAGLHFRALELRIRQVMDAYDCTDDELQQLLALHRRYRSLGHHDEVTEVVWHALARRGRETEADVLLMEYLQQHRRFRWPIMPSLTELAAERGIDQCLQARTRHVEHA